MNHNILLSKLSKFNFSANALTWIESYLSSRKQCTRISNTCSSFTDCTIGVPQGSILGPIFFSLYINDLPLTLDPEVNIQMYADDTVIYTHTKTREQASSKLTAVVSKVSDWLTHCCLTTHVNKTVGLYFSIKNNTQQPEILVKGEVRNVVDHFKYLSLITDSNLNFKKHIKQVSRCVRANFISFRHRLSDECMN